MPQKAQAQDELDQQIIRTVETAKPETVQQLITQIQNTNPNTSKQQILNRIISLQQTDKIKLTPHETQQQQQTQTPQSLTSHLRSKQALWYWLTIALTVATAAAAFTIPEDAYPLVYARYVLGTIFIIWLPGYAFIKALFPQHLPFAKGLSHTLETSEKNMDTIERAALSIGMSLALVPIAGLMLNYTPWGIRLTPIVLSLLALTTIFATAAIIREHTA
jgi:cation transport ATPase